MTSELEPTKTLDREACWSLLRLADVGRLAVIVDAHPDIFPVNYAVDGG
ncbi:MAG: pyridoxamine 5'-phosphate oxidase family protein, partial [Candidatus Nanopelagicales bacterium]